MYIMYIYTYIYIYKVFFEVYLSGLVIFFTYGTTIIYVCVYMFIRIFTISYTLIVVNFSFFHRLMLIEVQFCVNLNGTNRKEGRTRQEKKSFTYQKMFEAIVCKQIICHLRVIW